MIYALLVSYCIMINASPVICRVSELGVVFISELICLDTVAESFLWRLPIYFFLKERLTVMIHLGWMHIITVNRPHGFVQSGNL